MAGNAKLTGKLAAKADQLLPKVAKIFSKKGITFCLDGGTLLGVYREGRLLPWDNDLDFFVPGSEAKYIRRLKWRLFLIGCRLVVRNSAEEFGPIRVGSPRVYKIKTLRRYSGQHLTIDLIFKYPEDGFYHWVVGINPPVHKKIERKFYDTFDFIEYKENLYPIPSDIDSYLAKRYGNWRIPVREYNFKKDDLTIVKG